MLHDIVYCDLYVVNIRCLFTCNMAIQPGGLIRVLEGEWETGKRVRGQGNAQEFGNKRKGNIDILFIKYTQIHVQDTNTHLNYHIFRVNCMYVCMHVL